MDRASDSRLELAVDLEEGETRVNKAPAPWRWPATSIALLDIESSASQPRRRLREG